MKVANGVFVIGTDPSYSAAVQLADIDSKCFESEAMSTGEWSDCLSKGINFIGLGQSGSHLAGAAVAKITPFGIGYLYSVAVLEEYRKQGVATALMEYRLEQLSSCNIIQAHTRVDNIASSGLLKKYNFKPIQYIPDFYGDFEDGILWELHK